MKLLTILLQAADAAQAPKGAGGFSLLIMFALIFLVMWLFMVRPQQKKQKELDNFRNSLKKGDKIVTLGGIYGTVSDIKEKTVIVEVDNNVKIRVDKASIVKDFTDALQ